MSPGVMMAVVAVMSLPVLLTLGMSGEALAAEDATALLLQRYGSLISGFATPVIALLLGTSAFSAESEDASLLYLVTTTTPRWWIVASRLLFAGATSALLSCVAVVSTGWLALGIGQSDGVISAFALAVSVGSVVYAALFTYLALWTRRALMMGLLYVIVWEGVLSTTFQALRYLSVRQWIMTVASALTGARGATDDAVPLGFVLAATVVVLVAAVMGGAHQLNHPRPARIGG